jgi:hypothetical protein
VCCGLFKEYNDEWQKQKSCCRHEDLDFGAMSAYFLERSQVQTSPASSRIIPHHPAPFYIILHHPASSCIILHHPASSCIILHHPASSCIILHHPASSCTCRHGGVCDSRSGQPPL